MAMYATEVRVQTPRGNAVVVAGVVPNLPVPLLIGTDCTLFQRDWGPVRDPSTWQTAKLATSKKGPSSGLSCFSGIARGSPR